MPSSTPKKQKSSLYELSEAIIIAIILALLIRTFVVQAFKIPSGSMLPTLEIGDQILVNKFIYGIKIPFTNRTLVPVTSPDRHDVVVFKYPKDEKIDYIKRVIGVAGDVIEIRNKQVFLNSTPLEDAYGTHLDPLVIPRAGGPRDNFGPITVPEGKLFVMGDNRDNSYDSRFWAFVDLGAVRGKAFVIYWSWDLKRPLFSLDRFTSIRWSRFGDLIR